MFGVFFCAIKVNLPLDYYCIDRHRQIAATELHLRKNSCEATISRLTVQYR